MINVCNCKKDGGRPSEVGIQVQTSNCLMVLRPKVVVLSDEEKARATCQVWIKKMSVKRTFVGVESLYDVVKTRALTLFWDKYRSNLFTDYMATGIEKA
jgi:hypothetical protein